MLPIKRLIVCLILTVVVLLDNQAPKRTVTVPYTNEIQKIVGGFKPTAPKPTRYQLDAQTVDTADWQCVGFNESNNNYNAPRGGRWQLQGKATLAWLRKKMGWTMPPQDYPPAEQDSGALALYRYGLSVWPTIPFHAWWADLAICHLK